MSTLKQFALFFAKKAAKPAGKKLASLIFYKYKILH